MRPLESLRVVDFSRQLPGPWASRLLAELGAQVTRVVCPGKPDPMESLPPFDDQGVSRAAGSINRGKAEWSVDMACPDDRCLIVDELSRYDVLIEGFRPGVMAGFELDYPRVQAINPRLVYCSITGYGSSGAYANRAGHDLNYLALSGLLSHCGPTSGPPPLLGFQLADLGGGSMHALVGILSALHQRQETGFGCHVEVAMAVAARRFDALQMPGVIAGHPEPRAAEGLLNGGSWYGLYATRDGRYLSVGSLEEKFQQSLCQALGHPEWTLLAGSSVPADQAEFRDRLTAVIASRDLADWTALFGNYDACVEPVLTLGESLGHPAFRDDNGEQVMALRFSSATASC